MIYGTVNARLEAIVRLRVRGPTGGIATVDALIDTGFNASLTIPGATAAALELTLQSSGRTLLADGSTRPFDIHAAEVEWGGVWRPILVWFAGDECLLGMSLLSGHQLRLEATLGGMAEITALP